MALVHILIQSFLVSKTKTKAKNTSPVKKPNVSPAYVHPGSYIGAPSLVVSPLGP